MVKPLEELKWDFMLPSFILHAFDQLFAGREVGQSPGPERSMNEHCLSFAKMRGKCGF